MGELLRELTIEYEELRAFVASLDDATWARHTIFYDWTVKDEIMHLHLIDQFGLTAIRDPEGFAMLKQEVRDGQARGIELSQVMRERFGALDPTGQMAAWKATYGELLGQFHRTDPQARMPWFGPDIRIASFAAARQMEVWAHGQDVYDLLRVRRTSADRIRNICELGVRTHGWSFTNRGLDRPRAPHVMLTGPSGAVWSWNDDAADAVSGPAEDFALVVTQRRHVDDTALELVGADARRWMEIAQCFAGAPATGPAPGVRAVRYDMTSAESSANRST